MDSIHFRVKIRPAVGLSLGSVVVQLVAGIVVEGGGRGGPLLLWREAHLLIHVVQFDTALIDKEVSGVVRFQVV